MMPLLRAAMLPRITLLSLFSPPLRAIIFRQMLRRCRRIHYAIR